MNALLQCSCETTTTETPPFPGLPMTGMGGLLGLSSETMLWFWMIVILIMVTISAACVIWLFRRTLS